MSPNVCGNDIKATGGDDSEEDSLFGNDSDSDSDSDSSSDDGRPELKGRARWLKKTPDSNANAAKDAKKEAKKSAVSKTSKVAKKDAGERDAAATARQRALWGAMAMTEEELEKKVLELAASRGRKNTDMRDVLRQLEMLTKAARPHGASKEIPVLMHLISSMVDSVRSIDDYMDLQQWRSCYRALNRVLVLLEENQHFQLGVVGSEDVSEISLTAHMRESSVLEGVVAGGATSMGSAAMAAAASETEAARVAASAAAANGGATIVKVVGSVEAFILRLEDEYTKSLQQINPHTQVSGSSPSLSVATSMLL